ncbi:hypothetical protein HPB50_029612 [Hyalomma asiaticum]|nr:hypothetical protein HPB50_029612 [Hyalomma asiaticum]
MSDVVVKGCGYALEAPDGLKADGSDSSSVDSFGPLMLSSLKRQLLGGYGRRPVKLVVRYFRAVLDFSAYSNKAVFLDRCRIKRVVPPEYRVECPDMKNTHNVVHILNICSHKLIDNRMSKAQVSRQLELLHEKLEKVLSSEDLQNVVALCKDKYYNVFKAAGEKERAIFADLLEEYEINGRE